MILSYSTKKKFSIFFHLITLLFVLTVLAIPAGAQLREVTPETEGFSTARLQKVDSLLHSYTDQNHKIAGVVALVARHGKIIYYKAAGFSDIAAGKKMKPDDMFRIASQTKSITATAVMILFEEGRILLDDPISKYLPEFKNMQVLDQYNSKDTAYTTVPAKREITIKNLLTHTSGFDYPVIGSPEAVAIYSKLNVPVGLEMRKLTLEEGMKRLAQAPLLHQPGEKYTYGLSMDVLGYLVEKVSGMSFKDFLENRLFKPLGMNDTYFYVPAEKRPRVAKTYIADDKGKKTEFYSADTSGANSVYPFTKNGTYYSGGAGLISTAKDYVAFLQMLANGGNYNGQQILSPSTIRLMTMNQIDRGKITNRESKDGLGLSFNIATEQGGASSLPWSPGTYDWGGYWGSSFWVDPQTGIVGQIWTQDRSSNYREMAKRFFVMIYSALVKP